MLIFPALDEAKKEYRFSYPLSFWGGGALPCIPGALAGGEGPPAGPLHLHDRPARQLVQQVDPPTS